MDTESRQFLDRLLLTPSPSGSERAIQDAVRAWATRYADQVHTDRHGNVIAARNPGAEPRIMLAGHCDQLGLMVEYIDDHGFLYVQPIGGWDMQILLGQRLTVWAQAGPLPGVISRRPPHLLTNEERKKVPEFHEVWVDIGVKDKKEAEEVVRIGDTITAALGVTALRNDLIASPGLDDKVGCWTVMETLRLAAGQKLRCGLYCVSTVQEEIGLRGATTSAYGIHPHVGIAVDVTHATDTPGNDKKQIGEVRLGEGPVINRGPNINPRVYERLCAAAQRRQLRCQFRGAPRATGTDANAIQLSRDGVATGLVGLPNRYMHSPVETVCLADLDAAAQLLAEFIGQIGPEQDWTP
jgi:putative aminopeptidase FrvX